MNLYLIKLRSLLFLVGHLILSSLVMTCEPSIIPCDKFDCRLDNQLDRYTWEEIYEAEITTLVDQKIIVKSKIYWDLGHYLVSGITIRPALDPKLLFENGDQFIRRLSFRGEDRGNLFLRSNQMIQYVDEEREVESYALNCEEVENGTAYYWVQGVIRYRNPGITEEHLSNPVFIEQSNDVVYWSQKFEFVADMICKR